MAVALIAAFLLAQDCPSPRVQDGVFAAELVAGGPVVLASYDVSLEVVPDSQAFARGAPVVEVTQRYGLSLPHGSLTVALASNQNGELDANEVFSPEPYSPDRWSITCLHVTGNGKSLAWHDVIGPKENLSGTSGSLVFTVPADVRLLEIRYRVRAFANQGEVAVSSRSNALASWGGPPKTFVVAINGVGDLPATHFDMYLFDGVGRHETPYQGPRPAWTFERGSMTMRGQERYPPKVSVHRPNLGPCARRDCARAGTIEALERQCYPTSVCDICSSNHHHAWAIKSWLKSAAAGRFDARSLSLARNWIYARHGQVFRTSWLKEYFAAQPWYCPSGDVPEAALDADERAAVRVLRELEARAEGADAQPPNSPSSGPVP